jgi:hypothetical protein
MARRLKNVKKGEKITVYFSSDLDDNTKEWLENNPNKSLSISEIVIKYVNGELVEKNQIEQEKQAILERTEKEKQIMLERIKDLKEMLSMILPNAKTINSPNSNKGVSLVENRTDEEIASSVCTTENDDNSIEETPSIEKVKPIDNEKETDNANYTKDTEGNNSSANKKKSVVEEEDNNQEKTNRNIGIGNYKNGRGFRKKGKGLADLQ